MLVPLVAAAVAGGVVLVGPDQHPPRSSLDTPAAISAAIDDQVHHAVTLKSTGTMQMALTGTPAIARYECQLRVDGDNAWYSINGKTRSDPTPQSGKPSMPATDSDFGIVMLPGHLWMRNSSVTSAAGKVWTDYPFDSTKQTDKMMTASSSSTWQYVNPLRPDLPATTLVGSDDEQLDGVATTRYTLRVDLAALAQLSQDRQWRPTTPISADPAATGTYTLWLDRQSHLVRFQSEPPTTSEWTNMPRQDIRYSGWGDPVQITPPPPDQVGHRLGRDWSSVPSRAGSVGTARLIRRSCTSHSGTTAELFDADVAHEPATIGGRVARAAERPWANDTSCVPKRQGSPRFPATTSSNESSHTSQG